MAKVSSNAEYSQAMYHKESIEIQHGQCAAHHFCKVTLRLAGAWSWQSGYEEVVGEAVAKKSSKDRDDDYVGENLALARALTIVADKLTKRVDGHIKHNDDMRNQRKAKKEKKEHLAMFAISDLKIQPIFWRGVEDE
jgi:hypothetical protein